MKNDFIIYFNTKKVVMQTLFTLSCFALVLCVVGTLVVYMLDDQFDSKYSIPLISTIILSIHLSFYLLYNTVYIFFKTVLKKEKEAVIISDKGICRTKWYIFSKPVFIDWDNIDVFAPECYGIERSQEKKIRLKRRYPVWVFFNDDSICLKLKKDFYDNLPIIDKIACHLTNMTSNGYDFRIRLFFTKCKAKEVLGKMKEYRPKK